MTHEEPKFIGIHAESMIKYLGCPCEYFPRGTELDTVADKYAKAFAERNAGGYTPLIIVIESHMFFEDDESSSDFQKRIFAAPKIEPEKWFKEKTAEHDRDFCYEPESIIGEIAGGMTRTGFSGIIDYGIKKSRECVLTKIPTTKPWKIFAWFPFGGWDSCPGPEEMLWIGRYWYEKYGSVPAVMTGSELEFIANPVKDKAAAFELARKHFAFCPDNILQNTGTIGRLADSLTKSSVWYFWWD